MRSRIYWALLVFWSISFSAAATSTFPQNPNPQLTPGSLCTHPTSYRYKEHIPYCDRNVDRDTKREVIDDYNRQLGYNIRQEDRQQFKIDHLIPLCAGGSNEKDNLWPQHESVYAITDPLEPLACDKMSKGVLTQAHAIELIRQGKNHLEQVPEILREMQSL